MPRVPKPPAYRLRVIRGRQIAYVRLRDAESGRIKDVWLREYGSAESRELYARQIAEWEGRGRRIRSTPELVAGAGGPSISQLLHEFKEEVCPRYGRGERQSFEMVIRVLRGLFGSVPASTFGPNALRLVRSSMLAGGNENGHQRSSWSPRYVNQQVGRLRYIFKWGASREIIPATTYQALKTLEPMRASNADTDGRAKVGCVDRDHIESLLKIVSPQIGAMIELQLLTGMRPGEVCAMRSCDIRMSTKIWVYEPRKHKTAHRGRSRAIYLGPKAQQILKRFLAGRKTDAFLFSPKEAAEWRLARRHASRKTPLSCGNRPGTNRQPLPLKQPGCCYTNDSYRRAIDSACTRGRIPHWHPHQLRHNYATEVRKRYGLEAAQILLGHSSALVTEAVYAERDMQKARGIAQVIG